MDPKKYENVTSMIEIFSRFTKANWRKSTLWGLKASEVRVLISIYEEKDLTKGRTVSEISKFLQVTSPTVTQMVNNLIETGYVVRSIHPTDRRITNITLTDKGVRLAQQAKERYIELFSGLIDLLGQEESQELVRLLNQTFVYFDKFSRETPDNI
ncbi:MAG: hypothetical protein K0Q73_6256 [Paenibacillus sp.]|nr:hypothetical protein [Paenibacillus sp.]